MSYDHDEFFDALIDGSTFVKDSAIVIQSHQLVTSNSIFKNCIEGLSGSAITELTNSTYVDTGSTFQNNMAKLGGVVSVQSATMDFVGTQFVENYGDSSACIQSSSFSYISATDSANFSSNYAQSNGVLYSDSSSYFSISDSNFENNYSNDTSVIF